MKITILGCGKIGTCILNQLLENGHEITAIDEDPAVIEELASTKDVLPICGDVSVFHLLEETNIKHSDVLIASTNNNELNLSICRMAKYLGAKRVVAQIRESNYTIADLRRLEAMFNIDFIYNPDLTAAAEIVNLLNLSTAIHQKHFNSLKVMIMGASRASVHLCRLLTKANCQVKLLEKDMDKCITTCEIVPNSVFVTCADGTEKTILYEEGINRTDAFVALTHSDEQNMLISVYAKSQGVPNVITKLNQNNFDNLIDNLQLEHVVTPKVLAANRVVEYVEGINN